MKIEPELGEKASARLTWLPLVLLFLGIALTGLAGCGKSCDKLDSELGSYILGNTKPTDKDKLLKQCEKAMTKCPGLSSPYELMGDLNTKDKQFERARANYQKALGLAIYNKRIQDKIDRNETLADEQERKEAVESVKHVGSVKMSEYPKLNESIRLEWCQQKIDAQKEWIEKSNSGPKSNSSFDLRTDARGLDSSLIELSRTYPAADVWEVALSVVHNATVMTTIQPSPYQPPGRPFKKQN